MNKTIGLWYYQLVLALVGSALALLASTFLGRGFNEDTVRIAIRASARFAAVYFIAAYAASAAHFFLKNSFSLWLRLNRRFIFMAFFILFAIHLFFLGLLQVYFHPVFAQAAIPSLLGGGLAYFFALLLFLVSFKPISESISEGFQRPLYRFAGAWIWFIFIKSFGKCVAQGNYNYLPLFLLFLAVGAFKMAKFDRELRV